MTWLYIWLGVTALSLIVEFVTFELVSVWFVGGGLVAMILAALNVPLPWQIIAFIVVSAGCLLLFRKPLLKLLSKDKIKTNADSMVGKTVSLITPISFGEAGTVKVGDIVWSAITADEHSELPEGAIVEILEISGNKLIVKEKE